MELASSSIKKILHFLKRKLCLYFLKQKLALYFWKKNHALFTPSSKDRRNSLQESFFILQETETLIKRLIFFSKEICSYVSGKGKPEKIIYIFQEVTCKA